MRLTTVLTIAIFLSAVSAPACGYCEQVSTVAPLDLPAIVQAIPAGFFPPGLDKAAELLGQNKPEDALEQITTVTKTWRRPRYPERAAYLIGVADLELGNKPDAVIAFKHSIALRTSCSDVQYLLGKTTTDQDEALNAFTEAVWFNRYASTAIKPLDVFMERIKILVTQGKTLSATTALEKALPTNPKFAPFRVELAELYLGANRQQDALKILRDGMALDATDLDLKLELARMLLVGVQRTIDRPQIDEAVKLAAEVAQVRGTGNRDVASVYARTLIEDDKPQEADDVIVAALKNNPGDVEFTRMRAQILLEKQLQLSLTPVASPSPAP